MLYLQVFFQQGKEVNKKLLIQVSSFYRLICKHYLQSFWTRHTSYDTNSWKHSHYQGYTADQWRQSGHKTAMNLIPSLSSIGPVFFNSSTFLELLCWLQLLPSPQSVSTNVWMQADTYKFIDIHTLTFTFRDAHTHGHADIHHFFLAKVFALDGGNTCMST